MEGEDGKPQTLRFTHPRNWAHEISEPLQLSHPEPAPCLGPSLLAALAPGPSRPHSLSLLGPFNLKARATVTLWVSFALRVLPHTITMGRRSDLRLG